MINNTIAMNVNIFRITVFSNNNIIIIFISRGTRLSITCVSLKIKYSKNIIIFISIIIIIPQIPPVLL